MTSASGPDATTVGRGSPVDLQLGLRPRWRWPPLLSIQVEAAPHRIVHMFYSGVMPAAPTPPPPRRGIPLRDRPVDLGQPKSDVTRAVSPTGSSRHCFVREPDGSEVPGLIFEWVKSDPRGGDTWLALVVRSVGNDTSPAMIQEWIPASRLRPAKPA